MVWRNGGNRIAAALFFSAVTLAGARAGADPIDEAPSGGTAGARARYWYGWQTLAADGVANGFLLTGVLAEEQSFIDAWAISFPLGSPIIHAVHAPPLEMGVGLAV